MRLKALSCLGSFKLCFSYEKGVVRGRQCYAQANGFPKYKEKNLKERS